MALETLPVLACPPADQGGRRRRQPGVPRDLASLLGTEELLVVGAVGRGSTRSTSSARPSPDVVLMDVRMPEMNGIEATAC